MINQKVLPMVSVQLKLEKRDAAGNVIEIIERKQEIPSNILKEILNGANQRRN